MTRDKVLLPLIAVVVALVGLVWRSDSTSSHSVAVLFPGPVQFFEVQQEAMSLAAEENGVQIQSFDAGWSATEQLKQVSIAVGGDFDLIAIAAVDSDVAQEAVAIAERAGIPLVTFTNAIGDDRLGLFEGVRVHIGRDEIVAGNLLGEQIALMDRSRLRILSIEGSPGTAPQKLRALGLDEIVDQHPGWTIVDRRRIDGWQLDLLGSDLSQMRADLDVDVIVTQWAEASVLSARFLDEWGRDDITIVGLEWNQELSDLVSDGKVRSSTYLSIAGEGRLVIEAAARLLAGEDVGLFLESEQRIVTREQVDDVVAEW